jgi:hypothetical protein
MSYRSHFVATGRLLAMCVFVLGFASTVFAERREAVRVVRVAPMQRVEVVGASVDGTFLNLRVMMGGCDNAKEFVVKTTKAGKRATLWLEKPQRECMAAVMPSEGGYKVDLRTAFRGAKSLSLTIESSRGGDSFQIEWSK